jgi:putative Holliday junction resolvase
MTPRTDDCHAIPWPSVGRLAGIDYGTVRIGIAICDPSRSWAGPLGTYTRRTEPLDRAYFQSLAERESIAAWVIGLPIHCDGQESQKSREVRDFGIWLESYTNLPVRFFDERFTSILANKLLAEAELTRKKKKQRIDRVAAHLILEAFLESERGAHGNQPATGLDG